MNKGDVIRIKEYLEKRDIIHITGETTFMQLRKEGKEFSFSEHLRGLIYSLMSAQTVWANIEKNLPAIDDIFFQYNPIKIKKHNYQYFVDKLAEIKCRSRLTNNQMKVLKTNIETMEYIVKKYGSMDKFVTSSSADQIALLISDGKSEYKLKQVGLALACEYLKNVGIDCVKADVHLMRMFGRERLGISNQDNASFEEINREVKRLSNETGLWMGQIDYILWSYCATDQGEICTANPKCNQCVIKRCNKKH